MTIYHADLTGPYDRLIARLLPGDVLIVQTSLGERAIRHEYDWQQWLAVYDDEDGLRICRFGAGAAMVQNAARPPQRQPIAAAAGAVHHGGVVYIVCEWRQDANRYGEPFGPLLWLPAGYVPVDTAELATTGVV